MEGTVAGVRVVPPVVEFYDAEPDVLHQMTLTVQNLSKCSKSLRFHGPATNCFRMKVKNPDRPVAPGLDVQALIEFYSTKAEDAQDRVILVVDDDVVEIPLVAYTPAPQLELSGPADFGVTVADGKVLSQEVFIVNEGTLKGEFKIRYTGSQPITIMPTGGVVKPGEKQPIKIEFISKTPGEFYETASVRLEGQHPTSLEISCVVVERSLQLLSVDTEEKVNCIKFGSTYYGTDKIRSFLLYNNGPDVANFVIILEEGGEAQELGVDLTKSTTAMLASQADSEVLGSSADLTTLVTSLPSQGALKPGEKRVIHFRFSPRYTKSGKGWKHGDQPPPRRDYALFMHIEMVGCIGGVTEKTKMASGGGGCRVEVAVVGTALPVLLSISPSPVFRFGDCPPGQQVDALCTVNNESASLPLTFSLHRVAHFHSSPSKGHVKPGQSTDIVLSFQPNQIGSFKPVLLLDIMGAIAESFSLAANSTATKLVPIYTMSIQLDGVGSLPTVRRERPKSDTALIAHPNDRATSIRPANRKDKVKTLFTGTERYTYVDPDYALTDEEEKLKQKHKQTYLDYIEDIRQLRIAEEKRREFHRLDNSVDLGLQSGKGLKPPKISTREIRATEKAPSPVSEDTKLLSSKSLSFDKTHTLSKPVSDGLNAVPMTVREKNECAAVLSPQQLKQVDIGPSFIDFGQVCLRSVSGKDLMIVNNLDVFIHIVVQVDCRELRQTSPLSQVVPPGSLAKLSLMFESNSKGKFERNVNYTINGHHRQHILVMAEVVPVSLELSCHEVTLKPASGSPADAGLRGKITLLNKRNYPADFSWSVLDEDKGTVFSIRPSQGTVDALTNLDCEIVYHPSFSAPTTSEFQLNVNGGKSLQLKCSAELGTAHCAFVERRLLFGPVALNLTTTKTVSLKNTSQNHAYFEVVDTNPIIGMSISPKEGVVPVGGTTQLQVEFSPGCIYKFDTHIQVNVRGWKMVSLRVGGTVEPPCVDIDMDMFQLGGVYCGALATARFQMTNKARTEANMYFDLSRFRDFSLKFPEADDEDELEDQGDGIYFVSLSSEQTIQCALEFHPSEVAAYDFTIPVTINNTSAPTPPPSTYPPTPSPSRTNWTISELATPVPSVVGIATPSRRVLATALRPPLQLSHTCLEFCLPSGYYELGIESGAGRAQGCMFVNNSDQALSWTLHTKSAGRLLEEGTFKFLHRTGSPFTPSSSGKKSSLPEITLQSGETFQLGVLFTPPHPGVFVAHVPVILNGDRDSPYRVLELRGELLSSSLEFDPETVQLLPVPLSTQVAADFYIIAKGYRKAAVVDCEVPLVELCDGSLQSVLDVSFPEGRSIGPSLHADSSDEEPCVIPCRVTFQSPSPVSFTAALQFTDGKDKYELHVTATADNCLLTSYPFLAGHQTDFHIVRETQRTNVTQENGADHAHISLGEPIFVQCTSPNRPPTIASTTATSTTFGISTSSYQSSNEGTSSYPSTPLHEEQHPGPNVKDSSDTFDDNATFTVGSAQESGEKKFLGDVVLALQRYFSTQGWAGGPYPIVIPQSLRTALQDTSEASSGSTRTTNWDSNARREMRSIFDLVAHLCGRPIPGIPLSSTLPSDPVDRVRQLHWMNATLLTFLRGQGAMLANIKPEYLLDGAEYSRWRSMQRRMTSEKGEKVDRLNTKEMRREAVKYEAVSRWSWTDLLSQLVKVLILSRITPHQFNKVQTPHRDLPLPTVNPDPLSSNVYSIGERILLSWVNYHYDIQRQQAWPSSIDGTSPSRRWIVNFDYDFMDGLVLAAVVGAHAPFVISTHLDSMYTHPNTAEQCLHNVLKVVEAIKFIGLDYDVQPTDITEPNPIALLLLCVHLYQRLPQYLPRSTVQFHGPLHGSVTKHIRLQNPSSKPLIYQVILAGKDRSDFTLPMGDTVQVPAKGQLQMPVDFKSRFLRPCSGTLVLVGKRMGSPCGSTLVFTLETCIDNIIPLATIKCESPCYELQKVAFDVTNPFAESAEFRIVLVEARASFPKSSPPKTKQNKPKKNVEARTDHGQSKKPRSPRKDTLMRVDPEPVEPVTNSSAPMLSAFWCPTSTVHITANGTTAVEIHFLPFNLGHRQCSVLFINDKIGEFLYCIEANAILPLPSPMPFTESPHSIRISSAAAARRGRGYFGGDDRVAYWKCESGESFTEELAIPLDNAARESALVIAAQQRMSQRELDRRMLTGTLTSSSVTASVAAMGLGGETFVHAGDASARKALNLGATKFQVESSSKYYRVSSHVTVPLSTTRKNDHFSATRPRSAPKETIQLPVTFKPNGPGHYPSKIVFKSAHDIRVYQVECTVTPEGSSLELEFTSPTHQSVTQDIPVMNHSPLDWHLSATIEGDGFYGPPVLVAKALMQTSYPLMFRPSYEGEVLGKVVLTNTVDGTEQIYQLRGLGQKPLPLDHVVIECEAKREVTHLLQVPNVTKKKLTFQVQTDLNIVSGPASVTVLPGQTANHMITVSPWRRGQFTGLISFVATREDPASPQAPRLSDSDSDEESVKVPDVQSPASMSHLSVSPDAKDDTHPRPYRLWYSLEVNASKPPPEKTLIVKSPVHSAASVEIAVNNPTRDIINLNVHIEGDAIFGEPTIPLHPRQQAVYRLKFAPTSIGESSGSVVFQHESIGEFWYELRLQASAPIPSQLPIIQCELGKSMYQMIRLQNPTEDSLLLTPRCSNPRHFSLELNTDKQLLLSSRIVLEIPLKFTPSTIGHGEHTAEIVFHSEQLGDWVFLASGTGLMPGPADPIDVCSELGGNSSMILPFRNPTDREVVVDVMLKERTLSRSGSLFRSLTATDEHGSRESVFCLLLKHPSRIRLEPGETVDIPVSFAPDTMQLHEATVTVIVHRHDGSQWDTLNGVGSTCLVNDLTWIYPIRGVPELCPIKESQAPCIECKARGRVEERVEVTLTGVAPRPAGSGVGTYLRPLTPIHLLGRYPNEPEYGMDYLNVPEEFRHELVFEDSEAQSALQRSLGVSLVRKMKNQVSGVISLVFNVVFAPFKPFEHKVQLLISAASGGVWRFPLRVSATEPEVDDTITIESVGLNKESVVGFRMTSLTRHAMPFEAYFAPGSDPEIKVLPTSGELLPAGSEGTLVKVAYRPNLYGKTHRAKLVIQTSDMQWTYDVIGTTPEYSSPISQSKVGSAAHAQRRTVKQKKNYVLKNLKLESTGVSSPYKGAPLVGRPLKS